MFRSRMAVVGGAVIAAGLVLSGCSGSGGDGGSGGGKGGEGSESTAAEGAMLGQVPMAEVSEMSGAMGMWVTKKNFVKNELKKIVGYSPDGAKAQWQIPLGGETCWASPEPTKDGLIAVVFKNGKDDTPVCTEIGVVDLNKGTMRWHKQSRKDGTARMFDEVVIGGGTVAASGTGESAGWTVDGKPLWQSAYGKKCEEQGYAGSDDKLIAVRNCGELKHPRLDLQTVDSKTRAVKSSYKLPAGTQYAHVMSTDPLVVAVDNGHAQGGSGASEILSIDDSAPRGRLLGRIGTSGGKHGKYDIDCPATNVPGCSQFAVSKKSGTLFLPTNDPADGSSEAKNDIVAFSLKTGKQTGTVEGTDAGRLFPVGTDENGQVSVYQEGDDLSEKGGAVWRIDPASYKKTKVLQIPDASSKAETRFEMDRRVLFAGERLYIGADHVTEPSTVYKEKQPLAMVFGPKK
ncbi:hypothetical protein [Streptomyces chattanoogensis]|nr:hypothetical protein [Streptomyces chattanoogensis]